MNNKILYSFFFFNDTATTEIYTLSLHDALPRRPLGRRSGSTRARSASLTGPPVAARYSTARPPLSQGRQRQRRRTVRRKGQSGKGPPRLSVASGGSLGVPRPAKP